MTTAAAAATAAGDALLEVSRKYRGYDFEKELPFFANPLVPCTVCLIYVILVYAVTPGVVRRLRPIERLGLPLARKIGAAHNAVLSIGSFCLLMAMLQVLYGMVKESGWMGLFCDAPGQFVNGEIYYYYTINHFFKWYELADTLLIQIHGKRPGKLQVYHHAITLLLTWVSQVTHSSMQWLPIILNLAVHTIMYGYFAGMELQWPKPWWRSYLTMFQITQFIISLVVGIIVLIMRALYRLKLHPTHMPICQGTDGGAVFGMFVLGSFLVAFLDFFRTDALKQKQKRQEKINNQNTTTTTTTTTITKPPQSTTTDSDSADAAVIDQTIIDQKIEQESNCSNMARLLAQNAMDAADHVASAVVLASSTTKED